MNKNKNISGENKVIENLLKNKYDELVNLNIEQGEIKQTMESTVIDIINNILKGYLKNNEMYTQNELDTLYKIMNGSLEGWMSEWNI